MVHRVDYLSMEGKVAGYPALFGKDFQAKFIESSIIRGLFRHQRPSGIIYIGLSGGESQWQKTKSQ